ncbi:MAG: dihydropteroate synthase [Candidatus Omnitrophica bacterium]|jgi:dihydropteroate synthase|nr:dihydropteroate synthase [Candidatus Omnitrophota bacterium]
MIITPLRIENEKNAKGLLSSVGVSCEGIDILSPKCVYSAFRIEGIKSWEANIIKQHLLSLGSDSAVERSALVKNIKTDTVIFGSITQLKKLCEKLKNQPFTLKEISQSLSLYLDNLFKQEFILRARDKTIKIKKPLICGIINLTTDSFSGDGLLIEASGRKLKDLVLRKIEEMVTSGAAMIDMGAESSRPYSKPIMEKEEIARLAPVICAARKRFKEILISVDTNKLNVAKVVAEEGADIINDITALRKSPGIINLIKKHKLGVILMHMKASPLTMQVNPKYKKVTEEIISFFKERISMLNKEKINPEQILIDPGIGFGKTTQDNLKIINELYKFKIFGLPIFIGLSRKSFIGKITGKKADQRLYGTIASGIIAVLRGANILRVHDVKENKQALDLAASIINN